MSLLPLLLTLALAGVQDPVRVTAGLTSSRMVVGATTTLQISVETSGDAPDAIVLGELPDGLQVLGTSDFTQTRISVPGGRSRLTRRDLTLIAVRPGVYRIGAAEVTVRGRTYRARPLDLLVEDGGTVGRGDASLQGGRPRLTLWLQRDTVFVGEQVTVFAEAVFPADMRLRQTRPASFDPPAPSGFWIQDLPDPVTVILRVVDGRTAEIQTYRRAYFPLAPGRFALPPARLHYELRRGFLYAPESGMIESDSAFVTVLPLPATGRPASFNGAVGQLRLTASMAPGRITQGDAATLVVEVEGTGNMKALPEPRLAAPAGVEVYAPAQETTLQVRGDRVGGTKRFRWLLVPEETGSLLIPPVEYAYFDPVERRYHVLRSDTLHLEVAPSPAGAPLSPSIAGIRPAPGRTRFGFALTPWFAALQAVPLLCLALFIGVRRRRAAPPPARVVQGRVLAQLRALRRPDGHADILTELEQRVTTGVHAILQSDGNAAERLREAGAMDTASALEALQAELRRLRFAPAEPFDRADLVERAIAIITAVPVTRRRGARPAPPGPRASGGTTASDTASVLLLLAAAAIIGGATVHRQDTAAGRAEGEVGMPGEAADAGEVPGSASPASLAMVAWHSAAESFGAGDFAQAADLFHAYARARPHDPNGWYNHGVAAYRAGDTGRAVWAWLRTSRLAPRDGAVIRNLELAGAAGTAAAVRPLDRLTPAERALLAAAGWWLLAAAMVAAMTLRRRVRLLATAGVLLMAVPAAGALAAAARRPAIVPLGTGTLLLPEPTLHADPMGDFPVGAIASLRERREGFLRIRLPDGREAWVERAAVAAP